MKSKIAVVGLGYVGLPLALLFHREQFPVLGVDVDADKLNKLGNGIPYITDIDEAQMQELQASERFEATGDFARVAEAEAIIICVPTPLSENDDPDLSYLVSAMEAIVPHLQTGQLIVIESSTYPGTTEEVIVPMLEQFPYSVGQEVYVAYSPERIDPGNVQYSLANIPKVVSGATPACLDRVVPLYKQVFKSVVPVRSPKTAEMAKLLENTYRFINISFINEISRICQALDIDVWEVIEAAATKPFGFTAYYPGPGIGGHCIPVDPLYLKWKADQLGIDTAFINLAKEINDTQPAYVLERVKALLAQKENSKPGRILLLGLAYKANISDLRESPSVTLFRYLLAAGYEVDYHDPYIPDIQVGSQRYSHTPLDDATLGAYDCVIIATAHQAVDYEWLQRKSSLIFDTRNQYTAAYDNVVKL